MPRRRGSVLGLAATLLLAACGGGASPSSDDAQPLVVYAASATAPAIEAAGTALGIDVAVTAAGSQVLAAQVRGGAPIDVVLLADEALANSLVEVGLSPPQPLLRSGLSLVARPGLQPTSADAALGDASLLVVLADQGVPLGDATRAALEALGVQLAPSRIVSLEDSAASVLAKVAAGEADLAVVYTANALVAVRDGRAVDLGTLAPDSVVVTTWVQFATDRGEQFVASLRSEPAASVLRDDGFTLAPTG